MIGEQAPDRMWASPALGWRDRVATRVRWLVHDHPHALPLAALWALTAVMMRRWLFSGALPAGEDSAFLYSSLPYFASHHLTTFSAWLPSPLGQVQQYSIYWFLAMWGGVIRNPLSLYKGACFAVALITPSAMYGAAYSFLRSRLAAAVAAGLYAFSPLVISHWLAGHLNVEISFAVGPLAVWALHVAIRKRSLAATIGLGLAVSALYLLTTAQGVYWVVPIAATLGLEWATWTRDGRSPGSFLSRLAFVGGISLLTFVATSAVEIVPLLRGGAAPFVGGGESFYIEQLSIHQKYSLPFIQGVAGMPREDWLDTTVNFAAGGFGSIWFIASAFFVVVTAFSTLWGSHRRLAIAFLVPTVFAWLLAAGPTGPFHAVYLLLYDHIPYFRLIRVPNRWLIVSVFGVALLAGAAVEDRLRRPTATKSRSWMERIRERSVARRVAALATAGLVVSSYAFAHGLPTWSPPAGYVNAYSSIASSPGDWRILTTPFYQAWMSTGSPYGDDVSLAADLGFTSTIWHGHATIGRGGWDPRASRLVEYVYELTKQGANTSVSKLLGAMGVRYVALDPHGALEVIQGQNHFFREQTGLVPATQSQGVEIYRNTSYLPQAYVTPRWCVVAGGLGVLGDLAQQPSFSFGRVGLEFADQLRETQGVAALRSAIASSGCVITAPNGLASLRALLGATALTNVDAIAAPSWTREDVSPSLDDAADATPMVDVPPGGGVTERVSVTQGGSYSVWLRGPVGPDQAPVRLLVDGAPVSVAPLASSLDHGVRWTQSSGVELSPGTHTIAIANAASGGDATLQLVQTALMSRAAAAWAPSNGIRLIREDVPGARGHEQLDRSRPVIDEWRPTFGLRADNVSTSGTSASVSDLQTGRRYYTLFRARLARPLQPTRTLGMDFTGTASGQSFYLNVLFGHGGYQRMSFRFRDTTSTPRLLLFSPLHPSSVTRVPDWSKATEVTLSTNAKRGWSGTMRLDGPFLATSPESRSTGAPTFSQSGMKGDPFASRADGEDALRPESQLIGDSAALRPGVESGLLTFTQSYNPTWTMHSESGDVSPSVGLGFGNAYRISPSTHPTSISLGLARYGRIGTDVSIAAWAIAIALMLALHLRRRRSGDADA